MSPIETLNIQKTDIVQITISYYYLLHGMLLGAFDTSEAEILEKKTQIRFFCTNLEDLGNQNTPKIAHS